MKFIIAVIIASTVTIAFAANESPYSGQEVREIKALSDQEIQGYLNGNGMGYAKAAELNGYPGPKHVLELAGQLELTPQQIAQTEAVFQSMKSQAMALGKQLVEKERELDKKFSDGVADAQSLNAIVSDIGGIQAKIRFVHSVAHIEQKQLLNPEQVALYAQLRGYGNNETQNRNHGHHGH